MTVAPEQTITRGARYYAPLVVLAAIALAPFALVMLRTPPPADFAAGKALLRTVWMLVPLVWLGQVALVGGVASLVARAPSQLRAIPTGFEGLARAYLAAILAFVTVGIGALALGVPGLVLFVLLAPIGAFAWNAPAGPALTTCLTQARARWRRISLTTFDRPRTDR
ncbi:MAG: hypothetical protein NT062_00580 [Proteobacteria bacterium]|nr:hypothetical protein [Pseudomonadota bacterium]